MDSDLSREIGQRLGMARTAYDDVKRPIFANRRLPSGTRLQLFNSLVMSRLLYSSNTWSDIPAAQLKKIESALMTYYRSIVDDGWWHDQCSTNQALLARHQLPTFRALLAKGRLQYLHHLACEGHDYHWDLLLTEFSYGSGWLFEVLEDLRWLQSCSDLPITLPDLVQPDWPRLRQELRGCPSWKGRVHTALKKHLLREHIAFVTEDYHDKILGSLESADVEIYKPEEAERPEAPLPAHRCSLCPSSFATAKQLATHSWVVHGTRAPETLLIQSTVCGGCLKDHWTTARLYQHLKYRHNGCWDRLAGAKEPDTPASIQMPPHLQGFKRVPAVRRHYGPLRPTSQQRLRTQLRQDIYSLREAGQGTFAWWHPPDHLEVAQPVLDRLSACVALWIQRGPHTEEDLQGQLLAALLEVELPHDQGCRILIHWVEHCALEAFALSEDPDIVQLGEFSLYNLLHDFEIWHLRDRMAHLAHQLSSLSDEVDHGPRVYYAPHQAQDLRHPVPMHYLELVNLEHSRRQWKFFPRAAFDRYLHGKTYLVLHMYSGRRRADDWRSYMQSELPLPGLEVVVISLDTAIHDGMDINQTALWTKLVHAANDRRIAGLLLGPPCESWSSARHEELRSEDGTLLRGPRPLRSALAPWGLEKLSFRELQQIFVGSSLLLKGLWLALLVALAGSVSILEHPAAPHQDDRASIWRTGILQGLFRGRWLLKICLIYQWRFGAQGSKPTSLLYAGVPLPRVLRDYEIPGVSRPAAPLIGRQADGSFRTSAAKEYPGALNRGFAMAMIEWLKTAQSHPASEPDLSWAFEFAAQSASIVETTWRPDYQPI
eukprot:Skav211686  [mRNA]  locus=scaffold216:463619:466099:- [translate_table: standard]